MKGAKIYIMTDSQAALKALEGNSFESLLVLEFRDSLQKLGTRNRVKLVWVPGHEGIAGNEIGDELAVSAVVCRRRLILELEFLTPEEVKRAAPKDLIRFFKGLNVEEN